MLYKIRCNPMHPLYGALPEPYVLVCVTCSVVIADRYTYAPPRCRTSRLLFFSQCPSGTISVAPYSMFCDWRVSGAGPMPFYLPRCSLHFCLLLCSLSFLSFYGLVLWGWCLRTDWVLIALSRSCVANLF